MTKKLKKELKKLPKKFMAFTMIFAMLFSYFAPITNVFAESIGTGESFITFNLDDNGYSVNSVSINGSNWTSSSDEYHSATNEYTIEISTSKKGNSYPDISYGGNLSNYIEKNARVDGNNYIFTLVVTNPPQNNLDVEIVDGSPISNSTIANGNISINISGSDIEYHYVADKPNEPDAVRFKFAINSSDIEHEQVPFAFGNATFKDGVMPPNATGVSTINPINYEYSYDESGKVDFFIMGASNIEYSKIEINGVNYANQAPHTKDEIYEHHIGRSLQFWINDVPYNEDGYNVVVEGSQLPNEKLVGSFGWSYKKESEPTYDPNEDSLITHGKLEFVEVKYTDLDNVTHTFDNVSSYNSARFHETGEIYEWKNGNKNYDDLSEAWGEALVPYGAELTLRIVPDEGYQLVGLTSSSSGFTTTDEISVYKIIFNEENMGNGADNFHLGAKFEKVDDRVTANSVNVTSGSIDIDAGFENGTAKLEVNDIASLSPERAESFENTAEEEGYDIEYFLDISLYNSIYKGGKTDASGNYESWDTSVENIENNATITLDLANDLSGKDIALIHETHNENEVTGYELIDATYNEENNTITFETNSFSNYVVVSKTLTDTTKYTVTFNSNGGSEVESKEVTSGTSVSEPTAPTKEGYTFDGWYEDVTSSTRFDFNTPITNNVTLYAKWVEKEENNNDETEKYTVPDENGNSISFTEEKDREFTFTIINYLSFTDEQLEEAGIPKEMYNQVLETLKNVTKDYGTLLAFYEIEVINDDGFQVHESQSKFNIKIKMTDEMKKYNTFKIINVDMDDQGNISTENPINLKVEGDYLVGTLEHLSNYALTGSYVAPSNNSTTNNPQTGDNIYMWFGMLFVSILGLSAGTITATKLKKSKVK